MSNARLKKCPDCGQSSKRIQMIDKVQMGHSFPEYAVGEVERSIWTAKFPIEGRVASYMCDQCGRITLYGEPKSK